MDEAKKERRSSKSRELMWTHKDWSSMQCLLQLKLLFCHHWLVHICMQLITTFLFYFKGSIIKLWWQIKSNYSFSYKYSESVLCSTFLYKQFFLSVLVKLASFYCDKGYWTRKSKISFVRPELNMSWSFL